MRSHGRQLQAVLTKERSCQIHIVTRKKFCIFILYFLLQKYIFLIQRSGKGHLKSVYGKKNPNTIYNCLQQICSDSTQKIYSFQQVFEKKHKMFSSKVNLGWGESQADLRCDSMQKSKVSLTINKTDLLHSLF